VKTLVLQGLPAPSAEPETLVLIADRNLVTGRAELAKAFGGRLTSLEDDLMMLASAVFATDLAAKRGPCELYYRDLHLTVPVANLHAFERVRDDLAVILYLLSDDNWTIDFVQSTGQPENRKCRSRGRSARARPCSSRAAWTAWPQPSIC